MRTRRLGAPPAPLIPFFLLTRSNGTLVSMMTRSLKAWELRGSAAISDLLSWCIRQERSNRLLFTRRSSEDSKGRRKFDEGLAERVQQLFGTFVIEKFRASGWPGTELFHHTGWVFVLNLNETLKTRMVQLEPTLWNWRHSHDPGLPEDICIFQEGAEFPCFISVTHERQGWLISDVKPPFKDARNSRFRPQDLFVWRGKYFCRT